MKRDAESLICKFISIISSLKILSWKVHSLVIACLVPLVFTGSGGKMIEMSFDEFREYLKQEKIEECEAGFNSLRTFNRASGKNTGSTPIDFRKNKAVQ